MIKFLSLFSNSMEKLKLCMFATEQHVLDPTHPSPGLKNYQVFKSQITKAQIASQWAIRMQET